MPAAEIVVAVSVTPFCSAKNPPAVLPEVVPFVMLSQVALAVIVTVRLLAIALSPATGTDAPGDPVAVADHVAVSLKLPEATANLFGILKPFREDEFLDSRADFSNGGESGGVCTGEGAESDIHRLLLRLLDLIALDAGRYESGGDGRIAGAIWQIFSVDGEIERKKVKRLAVDNDWVGGLHGVWILAVGERFFERPLAGGRGFL